MTEINVASEDAILHGRILIQDRPLELQRVCNSVAEVPLAREYARGDAHSTTSTSPRFSISALRGYKLGLREAIQDRIRGGVLHQWLRKIRKSDAADAVVAPPAAPPLRILHLRPAEFLGLVVFWAAIFALW